MSSGYRGSRGTGEDGEIFLECKASFLSVFDDITDKIESKKDLTTVLQQSGRNPIKRHMDAYWTRNTDELSFNDFVDICRKEPLTTTDDLMKAFRKIDINGDGYISLDELYKIMNQKGEQKGESMSLDEVRRMINEVDDNKDGRLDYKEFSNMIMKTTNECKKMSLKVMERKERRKKHGDRRNSGTNGISNAQHKAESPKSPDQKQKSESPKSQPKHETPKAKTGSKTPRDMTEAEEDIDDDMDIVSTGRSTPHIDLHAYPGTQEDELKAYTVSKVSKQNGNEAPKEGKGKFAPAFGMAYGSGSDAQLQDGRMGGTGALDRESHDGKKAELVDSSKAKVESTYDGRSAKSSEKHAEKEVPDTARSSIIDQIFHRKSDTKEKETVSDKKREDKYEMTGAPDSARSSVVDDIFRSSARSEKSFSSIFGFITQSGSSEKHATDKDVKSLSSHVEGKPPQSKNTETGKDKTHAPTVAPRKEVTVTFAPETEQLESQKSTSREEPDMHRKVVAKPNENGYNSPSELRGDKDLTPVPSPRKRVVEDEYKPSPRPRKTEKGKSPATRREKLPDTKTLRDWSHSTSKGCFFYEDGEIVTHVYSLRLSEDSSVYLSAHPVQEPSCLSLKGDEPLDTALFVLDSRGKLVTFTEQRDLHGKYGVKCDLSAGEYQVLPYTTGCRFKQQSEQQHTREAKLVKDKDGKIVITSAFRKALEDIFDLCDLDDNGTMSKDEFNWFNLRTSGEELGEDEWEVVEERTVLDNGEITKKGFVELNEMEAEDSKGEVEDLWITLTSMGLNKALIMDEACPYRVDVYVEESGRRSPKLRCTGIESLEKKDYVSEICQSIIDKSTSEPVKVRGMKDLYCYTYRNEHRATVMLENKSRSVVNVEIDCKGSRNVITNRGGLSHTVEVEPQSVAIAHHLLPRNETSDWSVTCTETIHKNSR